MDGYAPAYVAHNIPLLVVSGLGTHVEEDVQLRNGPRIASEIPPVETEDAATLRRQFEDSDASNLAWKSREYSGRNKFMVKTVGRDYTFPVRYAQIPPSQPTSPVSKPVLHSTQSPLSPGSSVFPDGLIDPLWIQKHRNLVPSAFVSFYTFTSDPTSSTLHDNQLKTDINTIKATLNQSGYKTRFIVALLSEKSIVQSPDVEERLANIRKATGLDAKTSFFFLPPQSSPVELKAFVDTITLTIYPICIEYYRDLSKHSRRKKNRGSIPPPTAPPTSGTSKTLSSQGWNVRYDFKLGVFAEFRQEMDSAIRSYESGYETLLGDVLEAIASWSPRWNEARLLADIFAFRILRCLFWTSNTTAAVRRWQSHRERMRDFVDRRGKGSATYGWEAWKARWATIMGELIQKASIPEFGGASLFLPTEKTIAIGERVEPWEYLHHPGYWFRAASTHLITRRKLALEISEEDRSPPGFSPASQIASKAYTYDTYLCPEPHEENPLPGREGGVGIDHASLIIKSLNEAITEFSRRGQLRIVQEMQLVSATESMKREAWEDALKVLRQLWQKMTYRSEGWYEVIEEISWALRKAAARAGDGGSVVGVDWELMNKCFTLHNSWHYDLSRSLDGVDALKAKPTVVLHANDIVSFLSATYVFEFAEGRVGENCSSQLAITSNAMASAVPLTIDEITITYEGSMKPLILKHASKDSDSSMDAQSITHGLQLSRVSLSEQSNEDRIVLIGKADLTFGPGKTRIFEFSSTLREAGDTNASSVKLSLAAAKFDLEFIQAFQETTTPDLWWGETGVKKRVVRPNPSSITILPKPPKLELSFVDLESQYYTNEKLDLKLAVLNGEEADSIVSLDVRLTGENVPPISINVDDVNETEYPETGTDLAGTSLGKIISSGTRPVTITIPALNLPSVYELSVKAAYHLVTDMETPVYCSRSIQLEVINPFEANYDFSPRIHPDPWPSLFTHEEGEDDENEEAKQARGLAQKWCLTARYASFASDVLIIDNISVGVIGSNGGIVCHTEKLTEFPQSGLKVAPKSLEEAQFNCFTQKLSLDDRGTATLDISLAITWRRALEGSKSNTTVLAVPRLLVSSSEPRVLAAVSYSAKIPSMVHFDVTIENPSNHFLTFGLTMEPSEAFAFSGVKQSTLQLVPLSRRTVKFRLLPNTMGDWVGPIHCLVRDKYFQKVLKIAPTEGLKVDKEGLLVWAPPEEEP